MSQRKNRNGNILFSKRLILHVYSSHVNIVWESRLRCLELCTRIWLISFCFVVDLLKLGDVLIQLSSSQPFYVLSMVVSVV